MTDDIKRAIGELYERTGHLVLRRCASMLHDPQEALDVTQWVYMRAIEVGFVVRTPGECLAWLYRTATQRCLHLLRMRNTRARLQVVHEELLAPLPSSSPEEDVSERQTWQIALSQVDDRTAEIALSTYKMGLSVERTAELFEVSVRTVARARAEFAEVVRRLSAEEAS